MSLKAHIVLGTLLGVLLGVGAVTVLSRTGPDAAAPSAEAAEPGEAARAQDAVSPAALRGELPADAYSRMMRPGARRRSVKS